MKITVLKIFVATTALLPLACGQTQLQESTATSQFAQDAGLGKGQEPLSELEQEQSAQSRLIAAEKALGQAMKANCQLLEEDEEGSHGENEEENGYQPDVEGDEVSEGPRGEPENQEDRVGPADGGRRCRG